MASRALAVPGVKDRPLPAASRPGSPTLEACVTAVPLALADALAALTSVLIAGLFVGAGAGGHILISVPVTMVITLLAIGLYPGTALDLVVELRRLVIGATLAFAAYITSTLAFGAEVAVVAVVAWPVSLLLLPYFRSSARTSLAKTDWWGRTALVLGDTNDVHAVFVTHDQLRRQGFLPIPTLDLVRGANTVAARPGSPDWIILCASEVPDTDLSQWLVQRFPHVLVVEPRISATFGRLWLEPLQVGAATALHFRNRLRLRAYRMAKRAFDLTLCIAAAPLLLPLIAVLAVLVKLTSRGPIFYGHRRLGKDSREFDAWKFRTMVPDADRRLEEYFAEHPELEAEWRETQKLRHDPRVTKLGRFLRKTSLDELPQLWNVLVGQMSLVGPRPIVASEVDRYGSVFELYRQAVPGITGLWQVSGRNSTTYPERVEFDATYVRNWSLWLDLYILSRTVRTVVRGEGAC